MDEITSIAEEIRREISSAETRLRDLRVALELLESEAQALCSGQKKSEESKDGTVEEAWKWPLKKQEYARYGRQLLLPSVGVRGQLRLKSAAVLVVGAGGLGCPAAAYLAGAGVGTLGFVDGDRVEISNLHRQIAHSTEDVGRKKVDSLSSYCQRLNPDLNYVQHDSHITPQNAEEIVSKYDVVLDCTDHPTSRYLVSDICVLLRKPLVSASALKTDGQLMVLNNPPAPPASLDGGPCYRCIFPKPPPPDNVVSCGEGGILGPVVGVMGVLQALEAIRLIAAGHEASERGQSGHSLLLFSASGEPNFRSMKMRGRKSNCFACSADSTLALDTLKSGSVDYVEFCGVKAAVEILGPEERISAAAYEKLSTEHFDHLLLDVREREHFEIASLPGAINVPYSYIQSKGLPAEKGLQPDWLPENLTANTPIYVVCRLGNDSQVVTRQLKDLDLDRSGRRYIGDIAGGMRAWKRDVDHDIPFT